MKTFKGMPTKGAQGRRQRDMKEYLYKLYKAHKADQMETHFTLEEMLTACGMDKNLMTDYQCAANFLASQRQKLSRVADEFFGSAEYEKHLEEGLGDAEMFELMVKAAVSNEIYPLRSEANSHPGSLDGYHLMTLTDFAEMQKMRMKSIVSEIKVLVPKFQKLTAKFPELSARYEAPALPAPDGLLRTTCDICGKTFTDQKNIVKHYQRFHLAVEESG